jgi:hypothetical protein
MNRVVSNTLRTIGRSIIAEFTMSAVFEGLRVNAQEFLTKHREILLSRQRDLKACQRNVGGFHVYQFASDVELLAQSYVAAGQKIPQSLVKAMAKGYEYESLGSIAEGFILPDDRYTLVNFVAIAPFHRGFKNLGAACQAYYWYRENILLCFEGKGSQRKRPYPRPYYALRTHLTPDQQAYGSRLGYVANCVEFSNGKFAIRWRFAPLYDAEWFDRIEDAVKVHSRGGRMVFKPGLQPTPEDKLLLQRMSQAHSGKGVRVLGASMPIEPTPLPEANDSSSPKAIEQISLADPYLSQQKPNL